MKVNAFITIYNTRIKRQELDYDIVVKTITDIIKPIDYISFNDKLKIIDATLTETKNSLHPTPDRYRYFIINLISAYTQLECRVEDFDILSENKLLDIILSLFKSEYEICSNLMQMCLQDKEFGYV